MPELGGSENETNAKKSIGKMYFKSKVLTPTNLQHSGDVESLKYWILILYAKVEAAISYKEYGMVVKRRRHQNNSILEMRGHAFESRIVILSLLVSVGSNFRIRL